MRLDKWLKVSRLIKRRTVANEACDNERVSVNGRSARASYDVKEVAKLKSGSAQPNRNKVAEITWEQVKTIAEDKMPDLNCFTVESAMRMVAGTARSMGITVKGTFPESI